MTPSRSRTLIYTARLCARRWYLVTLVVSRRIFSEAHEPSPEPNGDSPRRLCAIYSVLRNSCMA